MNMSEDMSQIKQAKRHDLETSAAVGLVTILIIKVQNQVRRVNVGDIMLTFRKEFRQNKSSILKNGYGPHLTFFELPYW